ncbi:MAG: succinyl-CoA--3-ketoacid-CoA transferase [Dehalococcoidales bacterium]|nr:MAG: succinyl-CoA--3-ketoacid-CoA transferase [Dehalococcoidales bacterium]
MKEKLTEELVAMRAAKELVPGDYCNLGIGIPLNCAAYAPEGAMIQSENGVLGYGPVHDRESLDENIERVDWDVADAGMRYLEYVPGMSYFDMLTSFAMIRSGRLLSILGGLQVSEKGDAAIHTMSKEDIASKIGGSMDLAWGAKRLIVTMTHCAKDGTPKIVRDLTMPVTVRGRVNLIVTDLAVIEVTSSGLVLKEVAPGWTPEEIQEQTGATLTIVPDVREMEF